MVALTEAVLASLLAAAPAAATPPPNIVLMYPDNLGYGEVGIYGGVRGVPTPRLDALAREGMRLTNFNVETFCTPSRTALLTGRYGIRSGTLVYRPPVTGMTLWEVTIAETLKPLGYATAMYGKWHVGDTAGRAPTHQGFDEWYGIPHSSNEAQHQHVQRGAADLGRPRGRAFPPGQALRPADAGHPRPRGHRAGRRLHEAKPEGRPPVLRLRAVLAHPFPTLAHPDFAGKTGAGDIGDAMAEMDRNVGVILDAIAALGIERDTIVIWASDGGAEFRRPWRGTAGPWRGFYRTALEGGIRTPFMIRWPGRIPAGLTSNEIVHGVDVLPTLAAAVGASVPSDRAIDGVNQLPFLEGTQDRSNREGFIYFAPPSEVRAVKWRDWKLHYVWQEEPRGPIDREMKVFNLRSDPKEETDVKDFNPA